MIGEVSATAAHLRPLPRELVTALRRAHAAERGAQGSARVPAFRLTRSLLGGARLAGYPLDRLAACLGISLSSARSRGMSDGWIPLDVFAHLTDLPRATLDGWARDGRLPHPAPDPTGRLCYPASALIRALAGP